METKIIKITNFLSDYLKTTSFKGYVIGLSGGIDSALSASLAVKAIGKENIHGIILPCTYNGERSRTEDINDAIKLAESLNIDYIIIKLDNSAQSIYEQLSKLENTNKMISSNIKARLRMTTIRAYAESRKCLVLGTTNKTEEYLGYYTKAGDGGAGVDIEPIADLFKYEVFEMARQLGNIPNEIISRIPSAGLFDDQTDEDEIGITYSEIDRYLELREREYMQYIKLPKYERLEWNYKNYNFDDKIVEKIENMIVNNNHKRENPPYCKL